MSYEFDENYAVYSERGVTARKEHKCDACNETIVPGRKYIRIFAAWDGGAETIKRCARCQAIHKHLRDVCHENSSDMWPDERLNCGIDYREEWYTDPPAEIAALAFAER